MDVKLYPCCPALARMRYQAHIGQYQRDYKTIIQKGLELVKDHQMVVITGSDQDNLDRNCRLGKTTLARAIGIELLWKMDQAVLWFDFEEELIRRWGRSLKLFQTQDFQFHKLLPSEKLAPSPGYVCFVDEAHLMFPYVVENPGTKSDNRIAISFMQRVPALLRKGIKFVFVTAANPLDRLYRERRVSRELVGFFTAPVLALDADGPSFRRRFVIT